MGTVQDGRAGFAQRSEEKARTMNKSLRGKISGFDRSIFSSGTHAVRGLDQHGAERLRCECPGEGIVHAGGAAIEATITATQNGVDARGFAKPQKSTAQSS